MIKTKQRHVGENKWKQERMSTCAGWENVENLVEIWSKMLELRKEDMEWNLKGN